jgi:hypothetical protein
MIPVSNRRYELKKLRNQKQTSQRLSSGQNPEECDARDDDSSTKAGYKSIFHHFKIFPLLLRLPFQMEQEQ